jgi:Zn-dependent protease
MPLGPFAAISLIYLLFGVRVVYQLLRRFRQTFDRNFTHDDRMLVDQAAFFVLVPVSVALHELGHAAAIWLFGGDVLGWGYYGFAGFVAFDPTQFTDVQRILIAAAGTIVNLLLAAVALGLVFLKRPPMRAAVNELLIQFTIVSLLNALVLYPVLDIISGLNGDWTQMYNGGVPALSAVILVVHVAVLGGLFWMWRDPGMQARIARLTGLPPGTSRGFTGPRRAGRTIGGADAAAERTLREAADRVASGWSAPIEGAVQRGHAGTALVLSWQDQDGGVRRSVLATMPESGGLELAGALQANGVGPTQRALGRATGTIDADRLTLLLRMAMETVAGWSPDETARRQDGKTARTSVESQESTVESRTDGQQPIADSR